MLQPLDFSNQDLCDRSFKGRNLAGANFRKAIIRGCDFSNANLEGADFSGVIAGLSRKQTPIAIAFGSAIASTLAGEIAVAVEFKLVGVIAGAVADKVLIATAIAGVVAIVVAIVGVVGFVFAVGFAIAFAGAVAFGVADADVIAFEFASAVADTVVGMIALVAIVVFVCFALSMLLMVLSDQGAFNARIVVFLTTPVFLFLTTKLLRQKIELIRNATGTSFKKTELSNTKFTGASLNNCSLIDATLHHVDWTHASFKRCQFSSNLEIRKVRELCISRIGKNKDFSYIDLSGLYLVGVNLRGANLTSANLNNSNLSQSILENAILANTQAIKTNFSNATLTGACIEKWAITSKTIFTNAICDYIFLDLAKKAYEPASGKFKHGDFEKFVKQFTK